MQIQQVLDSHRDQLMRMPNVVGVGIGFREVAGERTKQLAIVVFVSKKLPQTAIAPADLLPKDLAGVPVDVREIGSLEAQ